MFAYCNNNPVLLYDPTGYSIEEWNKPGAYGEGAAGPIPSGGAFSQLRVPGSGDFSEQPSTAICSYYPPNNGFYGTPEEIVLSPGTSLQRIGNLKGRFVAFEGTPSEMLSLPYNIIGQPITVIEVQSPINALCGRSLPWFGQLGGGIQFKLIDGTVEELLAKGTLCLLK